MNYNTFDMFKDIFGNKDEIGKPWKQLRPFLEVLKKKDVTAPTFPIDVIENLNADKKETGIKGLPIKDFNIFGIIPDIDSFDIVRCDKCPLSYSLSNYLRHSFDHKKITKAANYINTTSNDVLNSPESSSSNSLPSTPTKAQKKELLKNKKILAALPSISENVIINDTSTSSDAEISSSGETYISDASNLSNNGSGNVGNKTDEYVVPNSVTSLPVSFSNVKTKNYVPVAVDKRKKHSCKEVLKETKKQTTPSKLKIFDPDKHCGVCTEENGWTPCVRSLTCKNHSVSLRRSVKGRKKSFDDLLHDHRLSKGNVIHISKKKAKELKLSSTLALSSQQNIVIKHEPEVVLTKVKDEPMSIEEEEEDIPDEKLEKDDEIVMGNLKLEIEVDDEEEDLLNQLGDFKLVNQLADNMQNNNNSNNKNIFKSTTIRRVQKVRKNKCMPKPFAERAYGMYKNDKWNLICTKKDTYWYALIQDSANQQKEHEQRQQQQVEQRRQFNNLSSHGTTININSIKKNLYSHQFFNLMNTPSLQQPPVQQSSNFIPTILNTTSNNNRYTNINNTNVIRNINNNLL